MKYERHNKNSKKQTKRNKAKKEQNHHNKVRTIEDYILIDKDKKEENGKDKY
jgi:hypothetical protein